MRRIKVSEGGVADPVTGKIVFPPPPAAGVLDPSLMNQFQEEIAGVIEGAGMTLDETKTHQLREAIRYTNAYLTNTTITLAFAGKTLAQALEEVSNRYIAPGVTVTIQLFQGTSTLTSPLIASHPQGDQIVIKGNEASAASYAIMFANFAPGVDGAYIQTRGAGRIRFEGLSIRDQNITEGAGQFHAVHAKEAGVVSFKKVYFQTNYTSNTMVASAGGTIHAEACEDSSDLNSSPVPVEIMEFHLHGAIARTGGRIFLTNHLDSVTSQFRHSSALAKENGLIYMRNSTVGFPVMATRGGSAFCDTVVKIAFSTNCFEATFGGRLYCKNCTAGQAGLGFKIGRGFSAEWGSSLHAELCTVTACSTGFYAARGSTARVTDSTVTNCDMGYVAFKSSYMYAVGSVANAPINVAAKSPAAGTIDAATLSYME